MPKKFRNKKCRIPTSQDFLLGRGEEADRGRLKAAVGWRTGISSSLMGSEGEEPENGMLE